MVAVMTAGRVAQYSFTERHAKDPKWFSSYRCPGRRANLIETVFSEIKQMDGRGRDPDLPSSRPVVTLPQLASIRIWLQCQ